MKIAKVFFVNSFQIKPSLAIAVLFLAICILSVNVKLKTLKYLAQIMLIMISVLASMSLVSHILELVGAPSSKTLNSMSLLTILQFYLISLGFTYINNSNGLLRVLLKKKLYGSYFLRSMLPFIILTPILIGLILIISINKYNLPLSITVNLVVVGFIVIGIVTATIISQNLNKIHLRQKIFQKERKRALKELSQFKYALDQSSLLDVSDKNGVITYINDKFCQISGFKRKEIIGRTHESLRSGYHTEKFYEELWDTISAGKIWVGGIKNKTKDGKFYWVHTSIIPFLNEQNEVYKYLSIRQDITNFKILAKQHDNLVKRNKEVEQFSYIASHDLQEPLNSIESIIEIIEDENKGTLCKDTKEYFQYMKSATSRMSQLIHGLLVYSRLGKDRCISLVNCEKLIDEVKVDLLYAINESKASITFDELPEIHAYKLELRQLFQNLISNAIKFRKEGLPPEIKISAIRKEENWLFSISDNGIGIADDQQQEAFALFRQLHNRDEYEGTGIGLAHCEKIVYIHGGEIWVTSELGKGSTFYFTIPSYLH